MQIVGVHASSLSCQLVEPVVSTEASCKGEWKWNIAVGLKVLVEKAELEIQLPKRGSYSNREPTLWPFRAQVF